MATAWREYNLMDLIEIIGGGTPKTSIAEYWNGNIPWLSIKDFNNIIKYVYLTEKTITDLGLEKSSTKLLQKNDIIISARGTVGELAMIPYPMALNQSCYGIRAKEKIFSDYLFYWLKNIIQKLKAITHGSVFDTITRDTFDSLKINLPPLETQQKIAKILSALDEKIELNNKINENLHAQAQAIFKSWFVDFEPFQNNNYQETCLGNIPSQFRVVNLESLCTVITKGTTPTTIKRNFTASGINFLKAETILQDHDVDKNKFAFIDEKTNKIMLRSQLQENDILLTMAGTIGRFAIVRKDMLPANINQALAIIRSDKNKISAYCLYSYFLGGWHTDYYTKQIQQAVQANLSLTSIKSLPIILPDEKTLQQYEKIIFPIIEMIKNIQLENEKLAQIRDTLLPKLMSGELEV